MDDKRHVYKQKGRSVMNERDFLIVLLYEANTSIDDIVQEFGLSKPRIYQILNKAGHHRKFKVNRPQAAKNAHVQKGVNMTTKDDETMLRFVEQSEIPYTEINNVIRTRLFRAGLIHCVDYGDHTKGIPAKCGLTVKGREYLDRHGITHRELIKSQIKPYEGGDDDQL